MSLDVKIDLRFKIFKIYVVAAQTLPTPRKFNHNHSDGGLVLRQRPDTSFNLPFGGRYDSESENYAKENLNKSEAWYKKIMNYLVYL